MIVLNAEIVGTVNEFYDVFKAAWENRTNIWERLNNYPNYNRDKIEKMKENPWDYEQEQRVCRLSELLLSDY